jgi:hypothetical protein
MKKTIWTIVRNNDGKKVRYSFDSKAKAEKEAQYLTDPKHPFSYRVVVQEK